MCTMFQIFWGLPEGLVSASPASENLNDRCQRAAEKKKRKLGGMLLCQRIHSTTDRNQYSKVASHSKGEDKSQVCVQYSSSWGHCSRDWFLSLQSQSTDMTQHTLGAWGVLRTKDCWEFAALLENLQYCRWTLEGGRDCELLKRETGILFLILYM